MHFYQGYTSDNSAYFNQHMTGLLKGTVHGAAFGGHLAAMDGVE